MRVAQRLDELLGITAPAHPFDVQANGRGRIAHHRHVSRHILQHQAHARYVGIGADPTELRDARVSAEIGVISHLHMPGDGRVVRHDHVIADDAVVAHVNVRHQQAMVADDGRTEILHHAAVNGDALADHVVVADLQRGGLPVIRHGRRILAHRGELVNLVVAADSGRPPDDHMRRDPAAVADHHVRADERPRADRDVFPDDGRRVDDGARVDHLIPSVPCR